MSAEMTVRDRKPLSRMIFGAVPLTLAAIDFAALLVAFQVLASNAPATLGEVATNPAKWALWIALVKLPIMLMIRLWRMRHGLKESWATGEPPDVPERKGSAPFVRDAAADLPMTAAAAFVVLVYSARLPLAGQLFQLVSISAATAYLLPLAVVRLFKLLGWLRHRSSKPRGQSRPDPDPLAVAEHE
jgi:hypothetical protein